MASSSRIVKSQLVTIDGQVHLTGFLELDDEDDMEDMDDELDELEESSDEVRGTSETLPRHFRQASEAVPKTPPRRLRWLPSL